MEEIFHAAPGEAEGGAEVVEVDGFVGVGGEEFARLPQAAEAAAGAIRGWRDEVGAAAAQGGEEGGEQLALDLAADERAGEEFRRMPQRLLDVGEEAAQAGLLDRADAHPGTGSEHLVGSLGEVPFECGVKFGDGHGERGVGVAFRRHRIEHAAGREEAHVTVGVLDGEVEGAALLRAGEHEDEGVAGAGHLAGEVQGRAEGGEVEADAADR